jgi:uncharacterized protein YcfJ
MNTMLRTALGVAGLMVAAQAAAQVTLYQGRDFRGPSFTADGPVWNLERYGFNDRASSAVVDNGAWQACEDARFGGECVVLQPGEYRSLRAMGLNNMVSSVRPVERVAQYEAPAPAYNAPPPVYDAPPPGREARWYDVPVSSVRAVVGPPEQRCWVERQEVGDNSVPGAIVGGVIGGLLGHQIGAGHGNTVATIGGAVAGAAVGSNVGGGRAYAQDVQRCTSAPRSSRPDYWDVTYYFHGIEHHVQMSSPPGSTITVDADGNPRA